MIETSRVSHHGTLERNLDPCTLYLLFPPINFMRCRSLGQRPVSYWVTYELSGSLWGWFQLPAYLKSREGWESLKPRHLNIERVSCLRNSWVKHVRNVIRDSCVSTESTKTGIFRVSNFVYCFILYHSRLCHGRWEKSVVSTLAQTFRYFFLCLNSHLTTHSQKVHRFSLL